MDSRSKWNHKYADSDDWAPEAAWVLKQNDHLLPAMGTALDLACGLGGNALFLARRGWTVDACDISDVALSRLADRARSEGLSVRCECRDLESQGLVSMGYDLIVVSRFLSRQLVPNITEALNPGGLLFYQANVSDKISREGPSNPDFLLGRNELLQLFPQLLVRFYREDARCGRLDRGLRNEAFFVGEKAKA